jgi:post-segregation antitoxin (ccd killing protein)
MAATAPGRGVRAGTLYDHGMAKSKITVTVDQDLVDAAKSLGTNLSLVVNDALAGHIEREARLQALREMLDQWDAALGPVPDDLVADAVAAFAEADGADGSRRGAA